MMMKRTGLVFMCVCLLATMASAQSSPYRGGDSELSLFGNFTFATGDGADFYSLFGRWAKFSSNAFQWGISVGYTYTDDFDMTILGVDGTWFFSPLSKSTMYGGLGLTYTLVDPEDQAGAKATLGWRNYITPNAAFFMETSYSYSFDSDFDQDFIPITIGFTVLF